MTAQASGLNGAARCEEFNNVTPMEFQIRSYEPRDLKRVRELFVDGMMEYCPPGENEILRSYIVESLDLDLADIEATYFRAGGHFWVATTCEADGSDQIVGTIAIERDEDHSRGELRRLTVSKAFRRHGLARSLVARLEEWAREHHFQTIFLNTGNEMEQAIQFYDALRFKRTHEEVLSHEPYQFLIFFEKRLTN